MMWTQTLHAHLVAIILVLCMDRTLHRCSCLAGFWTRNMAIANWQILLRGLYSAGKGQRLITESDTMTLPVTL